MIIALIVLMLLLSAFFSGSEIAFVAANRLRVEVVARRGGRVGSIVSNFLNDPATLLTTTLVGNNLALVAYSTLFALFMEPPLDAMYSGLFSLTGTGLGVATLITQTLAASVTVLLVGEIIPKSIFRETANRAVFMLAVPLRITYFALLPLIKIARWTSLLLIKLVQADSETYTTFMRREFELLIEESKLSGELDLDEDESTLLSNVFAMGSIRVKESMVPRTEIVSVEKGTSIADLIESFVDTGFSKMPVYEENIDHIKGMVFAHDLFDQPSSIAEILRPVTFVPESKLSKDLLQEFLDTKTSVAVVIDEYGGTAGLVTSEDLLEELFGDIRDEFDQDDMVYRVVDERTTIVSGRAEVDELAEETGIKLPEGDFETLAGYLLERLGTIPVAREEFELDGYRFLILQASANRVESVRIMRVDRSDQ